MGKPIKIRAKLDGDVADVKALMPHDMESGFRLDPDTGEAIPAHFIREVVVSVNDQQVLTAYWGPAVSRNPYVSFSVRGCASGDMLKIHWRDNHEDESIEEVAL